MAYEGRTQSKKGIHGADIVSRMPPEQATSNRGTILSQMDSQTYGHGLMGRGSYNEPEDFEAGEGCMVPCRDMPMDVMGPHDA